VIVLSAKDRDRLEVVVRKRTAPQREVQRARIVLAAADGVDNVVIAVQVGVCVNSVSAWRKRFFDEGVDGLADRRRSGRPRTFSPSGHR
jgi:transposase